MCDAVKCVFVEDCQDKGGLMVQEAELNCAFI